MKTYFVNYATESFFTAQENSVKSAKKAGFDVILPKRPEDISNKFITDNMLIMSQKKGAGLCLWKSYFIRDIMLNSMEDDDFIMYMDSSDEFNDGLKNFALSHLNSQKQFFVGTVYKNRSFTSTRCFRVLGCDSDKYWDARMVEAGCIGMIKTEYNIHFLTKWHECCRIPEAIMIPENRDGETHKEFIRHTYDQSILSILIVQEGLGYLDNSLIGSFINYNVYG